jgi:hypothetical protein
MRKQAMCYVPIYNPYRDFVIDMVIDLPEIKYIAAEVWDVHN